MQHNCLQLALLQVNLAKKMAIWQAEQDPNLPCSQVMFWAESLQCNSSLFNRVAGQVNLRGSLSLSASNVLGRVLAM